LKNKFNKHTSAEKVKHTSAISFENIIKLTIICAFVSYFSKKMKNFYFFLIKISQLYQIDSYF